MKVKFFESANARVLEKVINDWLNDHQSIEIIKTNSFANVGAWGYMILYK